MSSCEIYRFYKLITTKSLIEPVSMIVPRRVSVVGLSGGGGVHLEEHRPQMSESEIRGPCCGGVIEGGSCKGRPFFSRSVTQPWSLKHWTSSGFCP